MEPTDLAEGKDLPPAFLYCRMSLSLARPLGLNGTKH